MLTQEPTLPISELVPILHRSRTTIIRWAKRLRVGRRSARRQWRFTERDIERLKAAFGDPSPRPG